VREIQAPVDLILVGRGWWVCRRAGCRFRRYFETRLGAIRGVAEHLRVAHHVRLMMPGGGA
jgi:hypothetical protein